MTIDQQLKETLAFIHKRTTLKPKLGFILGSGLSGFAKHVSAVAEIGFAEIPHFSPVTVEGHPGKLVLGTLEGLPVAVMQGEVSWSPSKRGLHAAVLF